MLICESLNAFLSLSKFALLQYDSLTKTTIKQEVVMDDIKFLKYCWVSFLMFILVLGAIFDLSWIEAYRNIDWIMLLLQAAVMPLIIKLGLYLYELNPEIMGFGIVRLFNQIIGKEQEHYSDGTPRIEGTNFNMTGASIKFVGIIFCLLLMTALPGGARQEEVWFRVGTSNWFEAIWRSLLFGFTHMLVGVPVLGAIVISGTGLFYSFMYFRGGLELAAQAHFQYNLILVFILLVFVTIKSISSLKKKAKLQTDRS
jgi:hypothetical protein